MNKFVWGLLALALLCVSGLQAQDEKKPREARQPGERPNIASLLQFQRPGAGALLSDKEMEELKLDDKQKEKVSKLLKDFEAKTADSRKALEGLRNGGDPTKLREAFQKMREESTKVREEFEGKLASVLNDDQKKKLEELKKARTQRPGFPGGGFPGGGFGRGSAFSPGQILPPNTKERLELNDEQKKKIDELEKKVKDELNKILSEDQKKKLEQGGGRTGRPGGQPGARPNTRPRPDQN